MRGWTSRLGHRAIAVALASPALCGCILDDDVTVADSNAQPNFDSRGRSAIALEWAAPEQNEDGTPVVDLAGYRIWYGRKPSTYTHVIDVAAGTTSYKVDSLSPATYYFTLTAYNSTGAESTLSNEVKITLN